jgi:ATP-dependent helicase/nuclease subunit A
MEMDRDEVRVMTVHGAKGLEAPIVILADTTTPAQGWHPPRLLSVPPDKPVPGAADRLIWVGSKDNDVGPMAAARETALSATRDEYRRLLYVAMTRAIERLVVCGVDSRKKLPEGCWYDLVRGALEEHCTLEPADDGTNKVLRFRKAPDLAAAAEVETGEAAATEPAPEWLRQPVTAAVLRPAPITPSSVGDERMAEIRQPVAARQSALLRGSLAHRLLQSLSDIPADRRAQAAADYLSRAGAKLPPEECKIIAEKVVRLLEDPRVHKLYGTNSRAEVPIVGKIMSGGELVHVSGQIDRLAITQDAVLIADFKTNRPAPRRIEDVPRLYLTQLALYRALLTKLYPDKSVRAALIWTEVPDLMDISAEALDAALMQITPA